MKKRFRTMNIRQVNAIASEVKMMIHAHRDTLRNQWDCAVRKGNTYDASDPTKIRYNCREGFFGEAFGIMRGLVALGYGYFGSDNLDAVQEFKSDNPIHNCKWWFSQLCNEVLAEEHFGGNNECDYCLAKYGKDSAGRRVINHTP